MYFRWLLWNLWPWADTVRCQVVTSRRLHLWLIVTALGYRQRRLALSLDACYATGYVGGAAIVTAFIVSNGTFPFHCIVGVALLPCLHEGMVSRADLCGSDHQFELWLGF